MSAVKSTEQGMEIRPASSPGFYELWVGEQFCGMYYGLDRARAAVDSPYGERCRRRYGTPRDAQPRYFVLDNWTTLDCRSRWIVGEAGKAAPVDRYRSRCAAEHACSLLNHGLASVDPHAVIGCKVVSKGEGR